MEMKNERMRKRKVGMGFRVCYLKPCSTCLILMVKQTHRVWRERKCVCLPRPVRPACFSKYFSFCGASGARPLCFLLTLWHPENLCWGQIVGLSCTKSFKSTRSTKLKKQNKKNKATSEPGRDGRYELQRWCYLQRLIISIIISLWMSAVRSELKLNHVNVRSLQGA